MCTPRCVGGEPPFVYANALRYGVKKGLCTQFERSSKRVVSLHCGYTFLMIGAYLGAVRGCNTRSICSSVGRRSQTAPRLANMPTVIVGIRLVVHGDGAR